MGKTLINLTPEQLCDLMCGGPDSEYESEQNDKEVKERKEKTDYGHFFD